MKEIKQEVIPVEEFQFGDRLDVFLQKRFPAVSRGAIQRLIANGDILVNGTNTKPSHAPKIGEQIQVRWPEARSAQALPEEIPLSILFEDADLVILNKPPGLVVHPAAGHEEHTLVNALLHHCAGSLSGIGGVARPGIVHRLDKDTSGCLVAAKNDEAHMALAKLFAERDVEKVYHAIVCGDMEIMRGDIRTNIARHPTHRKRMAVSTSSGREAWTSFQILKRLKNSTLVEATLHTGRTHQIRVHFQHLGFPVAGDTVYGVKQNKRLAQLTGFTAPRQMLHAYHLAFNHPRSGERISVEAPWPEDFSDALNQLTQPS